MSLYRNVFLGICLLQILFIRNSFSSQKNENNPCQLEDKLGICKMPKDCLNSSYKNYTKCEKDSPLVCCPTCSSGHPGIRRIENKADLKCDEYFMFFSHPGGQCIVSLSHEIGGTILVFPAGGENSKPKDKIYMAILGYDVNGENVWGCGGSLISEQYILTAAHCMFSANYGEVKRARLGDLNVVRDDDDAEPQDFDIIERIYHPDYKPPSKYNDIALLKLNKKAELTSEPEHFPIEAAGWGKLGVDKSYSPHLQIVKLEIFTNEECNEHYQPFFPTKKFRNGIVEATQVCAGHHTKRVDTCEGDSGGPLELKGNLRGLFDIIGVTSFGLPCATSHAPGIYTRVAPFIPWIESIVWP